jgi:hypothetical protein
MYIGLAIAGVYVIKFSFFSHTHTHIDIVHIPEHISLRASNFSLVSSFKLIGLTVSQVNSSLPIYQRTLHLHV